MSDPAIRAALEAAGEAARATAYERMTCIAPLTCAAAPCWCAQQASAAAIAAFLRGLPVSKRGHSAWEGQVVSSDETRTSGIWHARELAAAVEAAAKEPGHE